MFKSDLVKDETIKKNKGRDILYYVTFYTPFKKKIWVAKFDGCNPFY